MKTIKKIWSILLVCGLILVPTISVSAAEQEPEKVEVSFFNENGEEVSVSEEIADSFMEQLDVDKEVNIMCKCCGAALKSLSDWQFAYSHAPH